MAAAEALLQARRGANYRDTYIRATLVSYGGSCRVFTAVNKHSQEPVAIKTITKVGVGGPGAFWLVEVRYPCILQQLLRRLQLHAAAVVQGWYTVLCYLGYSTLLHLPINLLPAASLLILLSRVPRTQSCSASVYCRKWAACCVCSTTLMLYGCWMPLRMTGATS